MQTLLEAAIGLFFVSFVMVGVLIMTGAGTRPYLSPEVQPSEEDDQARVR